MFDHRHYVPILKAKAGELRALSEVAVGERALITPLFELVPVPWDFANDAPEKNLDEHLQGFAAQVLKCWGSDTVCFVDPSNIPDNEQLKDGRLALTFILDECRAANILAIPVTGVDHTAAYQQAIKAVVAQDGRGVCLRVGVEHLGDPTGVASFALALADELGVPSADVDIIIDLGTVTSSLVGLMANSSVSTIEALVGTATWRTVTVVGGAFPDSLQGIDANTVDVVPRSDWACWQLITDGRSLARKPAFGDYGIAGVDFTEVDPRVMRMSANLRYTTPDAWLIFKGRSVRDHGYEQFRTLCAALVKRSEYSGSAYSAGDRFIDACSRGVVGPGNATTWRQVGTNHHLTMVARDLASMPAI